VKPSNVLILDDAYEGNKVLQRALSSDYNIVWVRTISEAMKTLQAAAPRFDLIICGVHLENESIFDFLRMVNSKRRGIPFVCFRWGYTDFAKSADPHIEAACRLLGAAGYIAITDATTDDTAIKTRIEAVLLPNKSKGRRSKNAKN
jgi:hypothetical protein